MNSKHELHVCVSVVESAESGTSTAGLTSDRIPLEISFHGNLSYAEKLLLKKHRREQLGQLPVDGCVSQADFLTPRDAEFDDGRSDASIIVTVLGTSHVTVVDALDAEVERVSFQALAQAVKEPEDPDTLQEPRPESHVSIVEINKVGTVKMTAASFISLYICTECIDAGEG